MTLRCEAVEQTEGLIATQPTQGEAQAVSEDSVIAVQPGVAVVPSRSDSIGAPNRSSLARNESEFQPIPASQLGAGGEPAWIWHGYVARGHSTLMTGFWKAGKTTLLAHLLAAASEGGDVGGEVAACKVLVVSEEPPTLWASRRDALGIEDNVRFILRPFKGRPNWTDWGRFVDRLVELVTTEGFEFVILDPLANLLPIKDENDAAMMLTALMPLGGVTEAGAGLLLLHHPRKGDGGEGQAARGSGALPGWVDVLVEMRRCSRESSDRRRSLTAFSRLDSTPGEQVLELTEAGYRSCGTKANAVRADRLEALSDLLPTEVPGITAEEVLNSWPAEGVRGVAQPGKRTLETDLKAGAGAGRWHMTGIGRKGDPHRFYRDDSICAPIDTYSTGNEFENQNDRQPKPTDLGSAGPDPAVQAGRIDESYSAGKPMPISTEAPIGSANTAESLA